jgi:nucleoside-diphosphate-sugar epimerase
MSAGTRGLRLLVAGITGQVGQGFIEACRAAGDAAPDVVAVVRRRRRADATGDGAVSHQLIGDVTVPGWGLGSALSDLGRVDAVLNLAGATDWTASQAALDRVNVLGAVHGLSLAQDLGQHLGSPVAYLAASSVFVAGLATGNIPEDSLPAAADRTPYETSKWYAEQALARQAAATGTPVLVARVGGVVGNSMTGRTTRRSSLFQLLSPRGQRSWPLVPAQPGARVDMLPRDVIGEMVLRLLGHARERDFAAWRGGVIAHLAAGEQAPTLASMLAQLRELDEGGEYQVPIIVPVPVGALAVASRGAVRYMRWSRAAGNRLHGLRYVAVDRVFERFRLVGLTGGWLPSASLESVLRLTFGLPARSPAFEPGELPLGRLT